MKRPFWKALAGAVIDGIAIVLTYFYAPDWAFNLAVVLMCVPGFFAFIGAIERAGMSSKQRRELQEARAAQRPRPFWTWRTRLLAAVGVIPAFCGIPLIAVGVPNHLHALTVLGIVFLVVAVLENLVLLPALHIRRAQQHN